MEVPSTCHEIDSDRYTFQAAAEASVPSLSLLGGGGKMYHTQPWPGGRPKAECNKDQQQKSPAHRLRPMSGVGMCCRHSARGHLKRVMPT